MTPIYPFSAIVGHDRLRLALVLCAVRPEIGGVLIRGEKGTAKSTAVRGLADVLSAVDPESALVELPIGATEDRVVGSLDLQRVLRDGEHAFSPGLLARAHGGVLYVDEVNLLHDHLVDVLLDAAAMGRVHIERDGISHSHEARFVLIGTMNPEEGELRPQLLDRFGLTVDVRASRDVDVRADVIRARMAFEADPAAFAASYAEQDAELARRIAEARLSVGDVVLPDNELRRIAALCAAFDVDGMRADLVVARTAVAHAAWRGSHTVGEEDIRVAAELALPHRRRRDPFDDPGLDPQQLDDAMAQTQEHAADPDPEPDPRMAAAPRRPIRITRHRRVIRHRRRGPVRLHPVSSGPERWWCPGSGRARRGGGRVRAIAPERRCPRRRNPKRVTVCTSSRRYLPPRVASSCPVVPVRNPSTSAARFGKAAKGIW